MGFNRYLERFEIDTVVKVYPSLTIVNTPFTLKKELEGEQERMEELKKLFKRVRNEIKKLTK